MLGIPYVLRVDKGPSMNSLVLRKKGSLSGSLLQGIPPEKLLFLFC